MLATGDVFAGYAIERQLGQGGMGSVYLARHPRLPRQTALKLLNQDLFADAEIRARFEREADLAAQLEHPNIVTVYDRGVEDGHLWISMQFVDGVDAASIDHPVPVERALRIVEATASALDHAHHNGVLHRDVKPANILLAGSAGGERVLLTDFGIARPREDTSNLTRTGTFTATLAYAAPEQLTGAALDHRADQYSLACTLFSLLTGVSPFEATNPVLVIQGHLQAPPPSPRAHRPELPAALDGVLARVLAKRPDERFDSCAEFAAAAWRAVRETGARPTVLGAGRTPPVATTPASQVPYSAPGQVPPSTSDHAPRPGHALYAGAGRAPYTASGQVPYSASYPSAPHAHPAMARQPGMAAAPRRPMLPRRRRKAPIVLSVVVALLLGGGYWVWQDESSFVAEILTRTRAHKDIAAMSAAFPQLLPPGDDGDLGNPYIDGTGYGGRRCRAYVNTHIRNELRWELIFRPAVAKWACTTNDIGDTGFALYAFATVAAKDAAVTEFERETRDLGSDITGTRVDNRRAFYSGDQYVRSAIVSTFGEPERDRWLLVVHRDDTTLEEDMAVLRADFGQLPLG